MAQQTYNEQMRDAMVRHQVGLLQFSGKVRNDVWKLLDASESDLRHAIEDRLRNDAGKPLTPGGQQRLLRLLEVLKETRLASWKDVKEKWFDDLFDLAKAEPDFIVQMASAAVPVELGLQVPSAEVLRAIVTTKPFEGHLMKDWVANFERKDINRIEQQVRIGMSQGESVRQISTRVVGSVNGANGVTSIARADAEVLSRSAVVAISNEARNEMFAANSDIIEGLLWVATLDSSTCMKCMPLDGRIFKPGELFQRPPLHIGKVPCRCVITPVFDGEVVGNRPARNTTQRELMREFAAKKGIKVPSSRDNLPHGMKGEFDEFANNRLGEKTGQVPAKTTYGDFLKTQSVRAQNDILGVTKAKLFRAGAPLGGFVSRDGTEMTLSQLAKSHDEWFKAAGLNPDDFQ